MARRVVSEIERHEMQSKPDRDTRKNGRRGAPPFATAGGVESAYDDPMSRVLGLDAQTSGLGPWLGFTSGSMLLLIALMALTSVVAWIHAVHERTAAAAPEEIDVMKDDPPPPPPPQAEPEAKPEPVAPPPVRAHDPTPPPPAPAQAAKVLAQEPTPDEPIDLTGNTIVQGNADSYAGGFTSGNGTSANAVRAIAAPTGVPGGTGPVRAAPPAGPDLSRAAGPGDSAWGNCEFPDEANAAQIDDERVTIQVEVRADGTPAAARTVKDPGNRFARAATICAMRKKFPTALDHQGNPISGTTAPFIIHFQR